MNILNTARKKLTGVRTDNSIEPRPSVVITTIIDNPRFKEANIDTSGTVPKIDGVFSIDVTNTGVLPTRSTRVSTAEIKLVKGESSLTVGTIDEPQDIGSISGGETQTVNIEFEREGDFLKNVTQEVCSIGEVKTEVTFRLAELFLAATYQNTLKVPVLSSDCQTLTVNVTGQSEVNVGQEYRWETNVEGQGDVGNIQWNMGDGTTYEGEAVNHSYNSTGGYRITVNTEQGYSATFDLVVSIIPLGIVGPVDLTVSESYTWNATGENLSQINEITWNMGDGTTKTTTGQDVDYIYTQPGNYTIEAVSDTGYNASLDVNSTFPNINISSINTPSSVETGDQFTASVRGDNLSETSTVRWSMGDGTTLTGTDISHSYADPASYDITVDAIFNEEILSSGSSTINAEYPDISINSISAPDSIVNGDELNASVRGDNLSEASEIRWSMGDGTVLSGTQVSHVYPGRGDYTITVDAIIDGQTISSSNKSISVTFPNITIDSISSPSSVSNQEDFNAAVRGNNLSQASEIMWDMGDGTILYGTQVTHRYATSGEYNVSVQAIIDGGVVSSESKTITAQQFVL